MVNWLLISISGGVPSHATQVKCISQKPYAMTILLPRYFHSHFGIRKCWTLLIITQSYNLVRGTGHVWQLSKTKTSITSWCSPTYAQSNKPVKYLSSFGQRSCKRIMKEKKHPCSTNCCAFHLPKQKASAEVFYYLSEKFPLS